MIYDLADLHETLITNFRTVRIPAPEPDPPTGRSIFASLHAQRAAYRIVEHTKDDILRRLAERRHRFFSRLEKDPAGDGRLHVFLVDEDALADLKAITGDACGPGDPVAFDPDELLRERLSECRWARELAGI
jgi:hypothetical protein